MAIGLGVGIAATPVMDPVLVTLRVTSPSAGPASSSERRWGRLVLYRRTRLGTALTSGR